MQESHNPISPGELVIVRDEQWRVLYADEFGAVRVVSLCGAEGANRHEVLSVLTPFDSIERAGRATRMQQRSRRAVLAAAAMAVAEAPPWTAAWTATHARIHVCEWQLEPALAAVGGATRILLADEVGLGKTIQAALIIAELRARSLARRVLVLTPASIREQWAGELHTRFGMSPAIFDHSALSAAVRSMPPGGNPWQMSPLIITSIDLVKRPEVRAALAAVPFDVLVVDEAHHVTPNTDRGAVVAELAARTPWLVLATATPHSGDAAAYDFLHHLGGPASDSLRVFRRAASPVASNRRRSRMLMVRPTWSERALLDATSDYVRALSRCKRNPGARLVGAVIARRAASSAAAASRTLARRAALLGDVATPVAHPLLPWAELDPVEDDVSDGLLSVAGLADTTEELAWIKRLLTLADAASTKSSKVLALHRLLRRTREPILIFSEYRDVVLQIAAALAEVTSTAALHGGLPSRDRQRAVEAFNTGGVQALVATDAAGEGLNLHMRCRFVVNVELPWSPTRLEQRIGRVDRIGQAKTVHALGLAHRDSYEGTVIARLARRRERASAAAVRIAGGRQLSPTVSPTSTGRRLGAAACRRHASQCDSAVYCSRRPTRGRGRTRDIAALGPTVVLVYCAPILDESARLIQREIVAIEFDAPASVLTRALVRRLDRRLRQHPALISALARRVALAESSTQNLGYHLEGRVSALLVELTKEVDGHRWQASLFDRRQEQRAQLHAAGLSAIRQHLQQHLLAARHLQQLRAGEPQLIAAWLDVT